MFRGFCNVIPCKFRILKYIRILGFISIWFGIYSLLCLVGLNPQFPFSSLMHKLSSSKKGTTWIRHDLSHCPSFQLDRAVTFLESEMRMQGSLPSQRLFLPPRLFPLCLWTAKRFLFQGWNSGKDQGCCTCSGLSSALTWEVDNSYCDLVPEFRSWNCKLVVPVAGRRF